MIFHKTNIDNKLSTNKSSLSVNVKMASSHKLIKEQKLDIINIFIMEKMDLCVWTCHVLVHTTTFSPVSFTNEK